MKIVVINGHPDPAPQRFAAALAAAYAEGAAEGRHQVRRLAVGDLNLPPLASMAAFSGPPPDQAAAVQETIAWADHLVLIFPLWLGGPPAALKAFLEQVFRPGFASGGRGLTMRGRLKGRSARIIVTMGMPAAAFRLAFDAAGLKAVTRGILRIAGIGPIRTTVIGGVEGAALKRTAQLARARRQGVAAC